MVSSRGPPRPLHLEGFISSEAPPLALFTNIPRGGATASSGPSNSLLEPASGCAQRCDDRHGAYGTLKPPHFTFALPSINSSAHSSEAVQPQHTSQSATPSRKRAQGEAALSRRQWTHGPRVGGGNAPARARLAGSPRRTRGIGQPGATGERKDEGGNEGAVSSGCSSGADKGALPPLEMILFDNRLLTLLVAYALGPGSVTSLEPSAKRVCRRPAVVTTQPARSPPPSFGRPSLCSRSPPSSRPNTPSRHGLGAVSWKRDASSEFSFYSDGSSDLEDNSPRSPPPSQPLSDAETSGENKVRCSTLSAATEYR